MESDRFAGQFPAEGVLCTPCRRVPPAFERAVAYAEYESEIRELIHLLKYERMESVAAPLGAMLARAIERLELTGEVAMVAVPLFPARQRRRGYNQSVLLADAARKTWKGRSDVTLRARHVWLQRVRDTESQFGLTPHRRRTNLRGAFKVSAGEALKGGTVLVIDDIYTTGATTRECARVLRRAGAAKVYVATLARAQAERVEFWDGA